MVGDEAVHVLESDIGAFMALSAIVVFSTSRHPTLLSNIATFETVNALNFEAYQAITVFPVPDDPWHRNTSASRKEL